jgi:hypothetical protein
MVSSFECNLDFCICTLGNFSDLVTYVRERGPFIGLISWQLSFCLFFLKIWSVIIRETLLFCTIVSIVAYVSVFILAASGPYTDFYHL